MSLILEALRKSEAERRRGEGPNVHAELPPTPAVATTAIPAWAWWLLAGAMLLFALWIARISVHGPTAPTQPVARPVVAIPSTAMLPPVRRLTPAPRVAAPVAVAAVPVDADAKPAPAPREVAPPAQVLAPAPSAAEDDGMLRLSDLAPDERQALPPLKISMHMWNQKPAQRFVILDGNRLGEGDRIGNAVITAITTDGVVLDWNGRRIKLPLR